MTQTTATIATFISDRLAEWEAEARSVADGGSGRWESWNRSWDPDPFRDIATDGERIAKVPVTLDEFMCHHDPARVLAQVAAMRAIVELHEGWRPFGSLMDRPPVCSTCAENYEVDHDGAPMLDWPCPTLRALASIWADQPGFREEWAL